MEGCTWTGISDSPDAAAMGLDNRTSQCQAHPGALGFRRKEWVEYALKVFRRQPYARVADRNRYFAIGCQLWLWRAFGVADFIERLSAEPEANRVCRGRTFAV